MRRLGRKLWARLAARRAAGRDEGFSTIEVIVALTVLSVGIVPLLQTQFEVQRLSQRLHQASLENHAMTQSLRYLRNINPAQNPTGTWVFDGGRLQWTAALLDPETEFRFAQAESRTRIGYYAVDITLVLDDGTRILRRVPRVGYTEPESVIAGIELTPVDR
jgi:type II secretory pathway pseudopilin PulG